MKFHKKGVISPKSNDPPENSPEGRCR
jgi:hypothetical protein